MGLVNFNVPIGHARPDMSTTPSMPVLSVNGTTPDRYGRVRIPRTTSGQGVPQSVTGCIVGDQYFDTVAKQMWIVVDSGDSGLSWTKQTFSPLSGHTVDMSTYDGVAEAAGTAFEALGGTVS